MQLVLITALGVGGATMIGAAIGFAFKNIPHKFNDMILGFAAGIMLSASVFGLIIPSLEHPGKYTLLITIVGIFVGAIFLNLIDRFIPHMHNMFGTDKEKHNPAGMQINKVMLFVFAIGIHNLPEGIAAGVGFGSDDISNAISVSVGIALHNIPEGIVIISPLLLTGMKKSKVLFIAMLTGMAEVVGVMIGYFAVSVATIILPFALAFAAGTMIYIVSDEMIPETHSHGYERMATYSFLIGFVFMLAISYLMG